MPKSILLLPVLLAAILPAGAAPDEPRLVTLTYAAPEGHRQPPAGFDEGMRGLALAVRLEDARTDAPDRRLGRVTRKGDPVAPLVSANPPADVALDVLRGLLEAWEVRIDPRAGHQLVAELKEMKLNVDERLMVADYKAEMKIRFVLSGADGTVLWQGTATGRTEKRGRKQSAASYDEVVGDAIYGAVTSLFENDNFRAAWRSAAGGS